MPNANDNTSDACIYVIWVRITEPPRLKRVLPRLHPSTMGNCCCQAESGQRVELEPFPLEANVVDVVEPEKSPTADPAPGQPATEAATAPALEVEAPQAEESPPAATMETAPDPKPAAPPETAPGLVVEFLHNGAIVTKTFARKPIGFSFEGPPATCKISKVHAGTHAEELGLVIGMQLTKIAGKPLSDIASHKEVAAFFCAEIARTL